MSKILYLNSDTVATLVVIVILILLAGGMWGWAFATREEKERWEMIVYFLLAFTSLLSGFTLFLYRLSLP